LKATSGVAADGTSGCRYLHSLSRLDYALFTLYAREPFDGVRAAGEPQLLSRERPRGCTGEDRGVEVIWEVGIFGGYSGTIHSIIVPLGSRREIVQEPPRLEARSEMFRRP
jgi:hypothetical protein